jgi:hypothetical protein
MTMPVEADVRFLNVDLLLVGRFDRKPLLAALGKKVFVLHEDAVLDDQKCLVLELNEESLDLSATVARLIQWAEKLPRGARRSWAGASRRVFDIGIQGGRKPHDTRWTIPEKQVAALARLGVDVALTVYGAEWKQRRALPARRGGMRRRPSRRS